jgi:hypothetical protein
LVGLRHAIDQAIDNLEALAPVIAVWTSSQANGAQEAAAAPEGAIAGGPAGMPQLHSHPSPASEPAGTSTSLISAIDRKHSIFRH